MYTEIMREQLDLGGFLTLDKSCQKSFLDLLQQVGLNSNFCFLDMKLSGGITQLNDDRPDTTKGWGHINSRPGLVIGTRNNNGNASISIIRFYRFQQGDQIKGNTVDVGLPKLAKLAFIQFLHHDCNDIIKAIDSKYQLEIIDKNYPGVAFLINDIFTNKYDLELISKNAKKIYDQLNWDNITESYIASYKSIV